MKGDLYPLWKALWEYLVNIIIVQRLHPIDILHKVCKEIYWSYLYNNRKLDTFQAFINRN